MASAARCITAASSRCGTCHVYRRSTGGTTGPFQILYSYVLPVALKRAWKASGITRTSNTRMAGGSFAFSARSSLALSCAYSIRALAVCPNAWAPPSVRPAPCRVTARPSIVDSTSSIAPWIDSLFVCRCHPAKPEPS
jgi:hypothetical protein